VFHRYVEPPEAVNVEDWPEQITFVPAMLGVGKGLTVKVRLAVAVQPLALVAVTVYVPAVLTVIAAVVAPVLHRYVDPPEAVKVEDWPAQITSVPAILGVGKGLTVKMRLVVAEQPLALVAVTV
jgi:hypothetical protein